MIGRLVHTADFQRALATTPRSRSAHFAVHHVAASPLSANHRTTAAVSEELYTDHEPASEKSVDNIVSGHWLGSIIPKRNARAAVTRNLLRRQIRAVISRHQASLAPGMWLVRLRAPYSRASFHAAASERLREAAAHELDALFVSAVR